MPWECCSGLFQKGPDHQKPQHNCNSTSWSIGILCWNCRLVCMILTAGWTIRSRCLAVHLQGVASLRHTCSSSPTQTPAVWGNEVWSREMDRRMDALYIKYQNNIHQIGKCCWRQEYDSSYLQSLTTLQLG